MDTVYKFTDCEVKKVGERQYEFTASTSGKDRDGEVIEAKGWDLTNFKKNPVLMYAHDYRTLPIGKVPRVWKSKGELKNTVQFPPEGTYEFADIVERLVDTGYLKTESVGFVPKEWEDGDGEKTPFRTYKKQELLEISIVPVPSNPDALLNAVEAGVITTKQLKTLTKEKEEEPEEHKENKVSQEGIMDEIEYLRTLIAEEGIADESKDYAWDLVREILRIAGSDIPDDITKSLAPIPPTDSTDPGVVIQEGGITFSDVMGALKRIKSGGK